MGSIKRLRWINLAGSFIFGVYGILIGSWPVTVMNAGIVVINIYYLVKMYTASDYFSILPIEERTTYLNYFIDFYKENIEHFIPGGTQAVIDSDIRFFILRNTTPAGLFACKKWDQTTLEIVLDYVTPPYQDFKMGAYVFEKESKHFLDQGFQKFVTFTENEAHRKYLIKMGFEPQNVEGKTAYMKPIKA